MARKSGARSRIQKGDPVVAEHKPFSGDGAEPFRRDSPFSANLIRPAARIVPADLTPGNVEALDRVLHDVCGLINAPRGVLVLLDPEGEALVLSVAFGFSRNNPPPEHIPLNAGIMGWVAVRMQPAFVDDVTIDDRSDPRYDRLSAGALAAIPLYEGQTLFGVLAVFSDRVGAFRPSMTPCPPKLLNLAAGLATATLASIRQGRETRRGRQQLTLLIAAARAMTSSLDPREVFENITIGIGHLIDYEDALIYAFDAGAEDLRVVAGQGEFGKLQNQRVSLHDPASLTAAVARNRRSSCHRPDTHSLRPGRLTEAFLAGKERALLCMPLVSKEKLRGVVTLTRSRSFDDIDVRMLEDLAPLIAAAIENYGLYSAVKAEQERLGAVFSATADGIVVVNGALRVIDVNGAFARMTGRPIEAVRGDRFLNLLAPPGAPQDVQRTDTAALEQALHDALRGQEVAPVMECALPGPVGVAPRQLLLSISPITTPSGRHVVVVARDITELRAMDQIRNQLLKIISHELRAPLHPLEGFLTMALRGIAGPLNDRQTDLIRKAIAISRHLNALVKDFAMILAPDDAMFFAMEFDMVDIGRVIATAIDEVELRAREGEITIRVACPPHLPPLPGNGERIGQVVRNLLSNAIKFTPPGGNVWVEVRPAPAAIEVSVADTGCGIAPEYLPYMFEPFVQAPREPGKAPGTGQGLGLMIVKKIVERHGGQIHATSVLGQGSRFTVVFPLRTPEIPRGVTLLKVE